MSEREEKEESTVIPDSMSTVNQLPSAKKVMSLQQAIIGKKIITHGSTKLTIEAWEYERKMRVHKQLKLARKLRSVMEGALTQARLVSDSQAAKQIFYDHREDMLELAALTDAVLGGYTCDDYKKYAHDQKREEENQKKSFESSQKYLNGLQQRMLWEASPSTFFRDNSELLTRPAIEEEIVPETDKVAAVEENPNASSDTNEPLIQATKKLEPISEKKVPTVETKSDISPSITKKPSPKAKKPRSPPKATKPPPPPKATEHYPTPKATKPQSPPKQAKKAESEVTSTTKEVPMIQHRLTKVIVPISNINTVPSKTSNEKSEKKTVEKTEKNNSFSDEVTKKAKKVKNNVGKKCHHCKETKTEYYSCGYWFVNGNKCKKYFCQECIAIYDVKGFHADDWHCPSCLKKCKCAVCVREREREELRKTKKRTLRY